MNDMVMLNIFLGLGVGAGNVIFFKFLFKKTNKESIIQGIGSMVLTIIFAMLFLR